MARALWTGNVGFGLVTIPVELYPATIDRAIHFHLVTPDGKCRLRQKLYCPVTGKEYDFSDTARGYEIAPDEYVIVDKEEMKKVLPEAGHQMEIDRFVPLSEIDPIFFDRSYILSPGKRGEKPYALLRQAMEKSGYAAIVHFLMRQKHYLGALRPKDNALVLNTLNYADEIRDLKELELPPEKSKVSQKELELAGQLISSLSGHFKPSDFKDEDREKMLKTLKSLSKGHTVRSNLEGKTKKTTNVVDIMSRLQASLKKKVDSKSKTLPRKNSQKVKKRA